MKPASGIKLSILIPTLTSRASLLVKLRNKLQKQLTALGCAAQVQALTFKGSELYSAGAKKSRLLEEAEGEYVVFIDDDDEVSDDYLPAIMRAIREHPGVDCIGMCGAVAANGEKPGKVVYSLSNPAASEIIGVYFRPPCPAMPIRRAVAGRFPHADITGGEDADLALRMAREQAIATEIFIDKVLITQNKARFDSRWAERSDARIPASPAPIRRLLPRPSSSPDTLKISCILTSYNRPHMVRQALKSLQDQTHKNFEVLLFDDSSQMNILPILGEFTLPISQISISKVTPKQRRSANRLSMNINRGLALATGDLLCFLADDDYYFPGWFEGAARYFQEHPHVNVGYGRLIYSRSFQMEFKPGKEMLWPGTVITKPYDQLDHNQVIHRRFPTPYSWPESFKTVKNPDAHYFRAIAQHHPFHPIDIYAAVKRLHSKNLQTTVADIVSEQAENLRE
jgi:spore maturation protein CgeD